MSDKYAKPASMSDSDYDAEKRADEAMQRCFAALHICGRPSDVLAFEQAFTEWKAIYARCHKREPVHLLPLASSNSPA